MDFFAINSGVMKCLMQWCFFLGDLLGIVSRVSCVMDGKLWNMNVLFTVETVSANHTDPARRVSIRPPSVRRRESRAPATGFPAWFNSCFFNLIFGGRIIVFRFISWLLLGISNSGTWTSGACRARAAST